MQTVLLPVLYPPSSALRTVGAVVQRGRAGSPQNPSASARLWAQTACGEQQPWITRAGVICFVSPAPPGLG
jgi:hypothetical protein